jgi:hypothetical protein
MISLISINLGYKLGDWKGCDLNGASLVLNFVYIRFFRINRLSFGKNFCEDDRLDYWLRPSSEYI